MCCTLDTKALLFCEILDCTFSSRDRNFDRLVGQIIVLHRPLRLKAADLTR